MNFIFRHKNQLIIHLVPIKFWLMGILFIGSSLIFLLIFDNYSTLKCLRTDKNQGSCTLIVYWQTKTQTLDFPVSDLISARVGTQTDWYESGESYIIMLRTTKGEIAFNQYSAGGYARHAQIVEKITAFLEDPAQTSLVVKQSSRLLVILYSAVICLVGLGLLLFSKRVVVSLDREKGLVSIRRKNVFSRSRQEIPLGELVKANFEKLTNEKKYRVTLVHQNGKRTPLTRDFSSSYKSASKIAGQINQFLGVKN